VIHLSRERTCYKHIGQYRILKCALVFLKSWATKSFEMNPNRSKSISLLFIVCNKVRSYNCRWEDRNLCSDRTIKHNGQCTTIMTPTGVLNTWPIPYNPLLPTGMTLVVSRLISSRDLFTARTNEFRSYTGL
jgi:hypothetical protein